MIGAMKENALHPGRTQPADVSALQEVERRSRGDAIISIAAKALAKVDLYLVGAVALAVAVSCPLLFGAWMMSKQFDGTRHRSEVVIEENMKAIASARETLAELDKLQRALDREAAESVGWSTDGG